MLERTTSRLLVEEREAITCYSMENAAQAEEQVRSSVVTSFPAGENTIKQILDLLRIRKVDE